MLKSLKHIIVAVIVGMALCACSHIDDNRIPVRNVNVAFSTVAQWDVYGVAGAYSYKRYIRELREPANFPFTANTYTGFGGILLVTDPLGNPLAYDLACPVEVKANIRVFINDEYLAECPECHSTYDVFSSYGAPVGDCPATHHRYGLRRYSVISGLSGDYRVITFLR
ncbi:MAG: hypothetical protein HDT09_02360 [Bacteroidales bacterium]|nr:hypothetical protein [Bacteroidales bacterium]